MTRPDERGEPTVHLSPGSTDRTVRLGGQPPSHHSDPDATVHLAGDPDATVHLAGDPDATVHLAGDSDATVHLAGSAPTLAPAAVDRTMTLGLPSPMAASVPTIAATGGAVPSAPPAGGGGEMRFGPGVPVSPPAAPPWPSVPPRRPRSVWRVTAVLSGLLTLVLVAAVGFWLWQRLSPLEVTGVAVAVPRPTGDACDVTVDVVATVRTNGRGGVIEYQWLRSGSPPGTLLSERVGIGQRTVTLTLKWAFSGVGSTTETATLNIVSPAPAQARTEVGYACPPS
ncbi:hypothetical protein V6U81_21310 [Micromonospora sp. CPCC 205711]|uniref:hypothetical protein n=1 Tax=Micromonospora sp. CPCC 205547 TaxID=3122400 RepID=UPI002FEFEFE5